jgi:hypothetical protein
MVDVVAGLGPATFGAIRRLIEPRSGRWVAAITLPLGVCAAVAVTAIAHPADRTFAAISDPVQSLMSVPLPYLGVVAGRELRRAPGAARVVPTLLAATLLAVAVGVFGALVSAAALAVAGSTAPDPWRHAGTVAVGGVLVQVVAQFVGTGLGLLLRSSVVAFLGTIVLPLGLWLGLGAVDVLHPARDWLTPYAAARHALSGRMGGLRWVQWLAVFMVWGVGLNAAGLARRRPSGDR